MQQHATHIQPSTLWDETEFFHADGWLWDVDVDGWLWLYVQYALTLTLIFDLTLTLSKL